MVESSTMSSTFTATLPVAASTASVCTNHTIEAVATVCLLHRDKLLWWFCHAVGKATTLDVELFALWLGVEHACHMLNTKSIVLFTDHIAVVQSVVDPSTHSGQAHSLAVCGHLMELLSTDAKCTIEFYEMSIEAHPSTTLGYLHKAKVEACKDKWTRLFALPTYASKDFLHLHKGDNKVIQPMYLHSGAWLLKLISLTLVHWVLVKLHDQGGS
ncbi:hypothetical protein D9756_011611 [Leucocoprinus leucothites]|uniref:RNase H type-1 domain-containing protein n=1 Tax=Leucocoprinus leucothites TaxID=201217 RepID=A0A8H5CQX8_9AGAR|nr:hypothetical protein D9756_011611 [Leucoagaricus leucothites]